MSEGNAPSRGRKKSRRKPDPEVDPEFQIAPMIDILLVLLVFFMSISSTEVLQASKDVVLPVAKAAKDPSKNNPGQVIVNISYNAINDAVAITVNDRVYPTPGDLTPVLQEAVQRNPVVRVLIRADRNVRYDSIRGLLKAVGDAGISNVTFSAVDKEVEEANQ